MSTTKNFDLTLLDPNQAQKDVTVNTALVVLDGFVQPSVISAALTLAPTSPNDQDKYIVAAGATGVWTGQSNNVAVYQANGSTWSFFPPQPGWLVFNQATSGFLVWNANTWETIGSATGENALSILAALTQTQAQLLAAIAALSPIAGNIIAGNGTTWVIETPLQVFGLQAAMMAIIYGG